MAGGFARTIYISTGCTEDFGLMESASILPGAIIDYGFCWLLLLAYTFVARKISFIVVERKG